MRHSLHYVVKLFAAVVLGSAALATAQASPAPAATLYHCDPGATGYTYACTTITGAPASGVQVLDRDHDSVWTLRNGNSVVLLGWGVDQYGRCGINGDAYVWHIGWYANGSFHSGMIGDYYLATGSAATWGAFTDSFGRLDNDAHYAGRAAASATCDFIRFVR